MAAYPQPVVAFGFVVFGGVRNDQTYFVPLKDSTRREVAPTDKDDQIKWLAARDKQFKYNRQHVHKEAKESGFEGGQDEIMILTDKNSMFVRDRVVELLNKLPNNYSANKYKGKTYKVSTE